MANDRLGYPQIPQRPSFLDDEEAAVKRAIELSLLSAKEDDQRRKDLYGAGDRSTPSPVSSSFYTGSSSNANEGSVSQNKTTTISRPRPQASSSGAPNRDHGGVQIMAPPKSNRGPVVPPRPDVSHFATLPPRPKKISQHLLDKQVLPPSEGRTCDSSDRVSLAELEGLAPRVPPALGSVSRLPTHNRPFSERDSQSAVRNKDLFAAHRSQSVPPGNPRSGLLTPENSPVIPRRPSPTPIPMTHMQNRISGEQPLICLSPKLDPLDFNLDSLDPLNDGYNPKIAITPTTTGGPALSAATLAAKLRRSDNLLGATDLQKQRSSSAGTLAPNTNQSTNHTYSTHIPVANSTWAPNSNTNPERSLVPLNAAKSTSNIKTETSPLPERKSMNASSAPTTVAIRNASQKLVSDVKFSKNPAYSPMEPGLYLKTSTAGTSKLDDSSSGYLVPTPQRPPDSNARQSTASMASDTSRSSIYTIPDGAMVPHGPSPDDLMDFSASNQSYDYMYLSLESFDPLYSVEKSLDDERQESTDSLGLFPNPFDRLQRKNTPNPFPTINPVTTQNLMRKSSCDISGSSTTLDHVDKEDGGRAAPSRAPGPDAMTESIHELQDPFSVPDLLKALERKRQNHVREQADRLAVSSSELEPSTDIEKDTAKKPEVSTDEGATSCLLRPKKNPKQYNRRSSYIQNGEESSYEILHDFPETADEEIQAFCGMVASLKMRHRNTDESTNPGVVISPRCKHPTHKGMTVKIMVKAPFIEEPGYPFTCDVNATVSHVIGAVLLSATDDMGHTSTDEFMLKVWGLTEYILNDTVLADYAFVQECMKLDVDIKFVLTRKSKMSKPFKRTPEDDRNALFVPKTRDTAEKGMKITKEKLNILMETFYKEVEKLRDNAIQNGLDRVQCKSVIQSVKAICAVLYKMETIDVLRAIDRLQSVNMEKNLHMTSVHNPEAYGYVTKDGDNIIPVRDAETVRKVSDLDDLHIALEEMTMAVKAMIELHCRTFHTDFRFRSTTQVIREEREASDVMENLIVHIATANRISNKVKSTYQDFKILCCLYYGGCKVAQEVMTSQRPSWSPIFGDTLIWDEWLLFDSVIVCNLPREARLCLTLIGVKVVQSSGSDQTHKVNTPLGWVGLQLFNYDFKLTQGSQLLGLWPGDMANPTGTSISNTEMPGSILIQVNMPQFECDYLFPAIQCISSSLKQDFDSLHPNDQELLTCILEKDSITRLTVAEGEFLWEKRHFLYTWPAALARVVQQVGMWHWSALMETYSMISEWSPLKPEQALELLLPHYPDTFVRDRGAIWLGEAMTDEFCDYLPQLVQALKFESYHTSALARLILEKAISSVRVAHQLYWLLKEAADDICFRKRYQLMFGALLSVVGEGMRKELAKEEDTVKMFSAIAEKVKSAKDKEGVLGRELYNMWEFLQFDSVCLPLNPAMEIMGVDVKSCSYFTSFTFPLKLVLKNVDTKADAHYAMFKVGDDLRQDMLTMQLIDVMDKLWLQDGLDLKMITFVCVHTGIKRGLVEIITESETLRKIQTKHGVGGSFKDRPIAEWLQLQNPTELEYQKACDNFTASCAGYCVATYILGIGDRHNDNIMIKQSGHMFHIDFAKFLGDAQMMGTIKRDRVPFVLTSDMAYVINFGDKPSHKFQHFVDLCCQAFNIIRRHGNLFINLLSMMCQSGIPGVTESAGKYVQKALLPDASDAEATAVFTRMIHDSLKSTFTQFNFFIHNLAQMKFHGHSDGALLSFIPKTYSINQDGRIKHVEIHGIQKRYSPEKFYIYIIRVERENQTVPCLVFRRYSEFQELHHKLVMTYPLVRLPRLHNRVILGRTHIRTVAEERRAELELFLRELLHLAPEISECDLIYTFFHPMLRDEQDAGKINLQKLKEPSPQRTLSRAIQGQVKLSITYKNNLLTVMVMHVKDLGLETGGDAPDPYVKLYLLPDPMKVTKRKTKIQKHTFHPTYNEMLYYHMPLEEVKTRTLQITVWNFDKMKENEFLGANFVKLCELELTKETVAWYHLQSMHCISTGAR